MLKGICLYSADFVITYWEFLEDILIAIFKAFIFSQRFLVDRFIWIIDILSPENDIKLFIGNKLSYVSRQVTKCWCDGSVHYNP